MLFIINTIMQHVQVMAEVNVIALGLKTIIINYLKDITQPGPAKP